MCGALISILPIRLHNVVVPNMNNFTLAVLLVCLRDYIYIIQIKK
jgi:hypothetical protein